MTRPRQYDAVILGSGFGGSLTAAILGRAGLSVALVDPHRHPRFAIGESSTPVADSLLADLARRHDLPELLPLARFGSWQQTYPHLLCGCKRGFSYFWHAGETGFQPTLDHRHELFVTANASRDAADTHWYRSDVDHYLANLAESRSADLLEETRLVALEHPRPHAWNLTLLRRGCRRQIQSEFLLDASGSAGALMRQLPLQDETKNLLTRSAAVYGHWQSFPLFQDWLKEKGAAWRDYPFPCDDSVIHHLFSDGWAWQLRFEDGRTSLGSVFTPGLPRETHRTSRELLTDNRPVLEHFLQSAQLADVPGRLFRTGRLQRLWNAGAGEDWAALPFTIGFIDPLHSTGIAHTLLGIERLCQIVLTESPSQRTPSLENYSRQVIRELHLMDRLVSGCYWGLRDFRLFTAWSMFYFAAATCFESRRLSRSGEEAGFLLANDAGFVERVHELHQTLRHLVRTAKRSDARSIQHFTEEVKAAIAPYNQVGLFEAGIPNMYHHTAAEKG